MRWGRATVELLELGGGVPVGSWWHGSLQGAQPLNGEGLTQQAQASSRSLGSPQGDPSAMPVDTLPPSNFPGAAAGSR